MNKVDFIRYSLEDGTFTFDLTNNEDGFLVNPILKDDLYIEIFFTPVPESAAKLAFADAAHHFTSATIQANKRCKNPYDCDYSENDIEIIKHEAELAVKTFKISIQNKG